MSAGPVINPGAITAAVAAVKTVVDAISTALTTLAGKVGNPVAGTVATTLEAVQTALGTVTDGAIDTIGKALGASDDAAGTIGTAEQSMQSSLRGAWQAVLDAYTRMGAPAGASMSADTAAVKADTGAIKTETDKLGAPVGASHSADTAAVKSAVDALAAEVGDFGASDAATVLGVPSASVSADIAAVGAALGTPSSSDVATRLESLQGEVGDFGVSDLATEIGDIETAIGLPGVDLATDIGAAKTAAENAGTATRTVELGGVNAGSTLAAHPTDGKVASDSASQSLTYLVLHVVDQSLQEGSRAALLRALTVLRWGAKVTGGGGPGTGATQWYVVPQTSTLAPGDAPAGGVAITGDLAEGAVESDRTYSGLLKAAAIPATGGLKLCLLGKVDNVLDSITGYLYESIETTASYEVSP